MKRFCALALLGRRLLLSAVFVLGCKEEQERPPPATWQCSGLGCRPPDIGARPPTPGGGGEGGEGSGDGSGGEDDGRAVTLTGSVGLLLDDGFELADTFDELVDLRAEAPGDRSVLGSAPGTGSFEIEGVLRAPAIWVLGTPRSGASPALPTLETMRTDNPNSQGVVVSENPFVLVRADVIEEAFTRTSTSVLFDPAKAQIVMKLTSRTSGSGVAGIEVTAPEAELVMYSVNGAFSDVPEETDSSGLVMLGNVPASAWPGRAISVTFTGAATSSIELPTINKTVTVVPLIP